MAIYEISAAAVIAAATPDDVWRVLDDVAHWHEWMPGMEHVHVHMPSTNNHFNVQLVQHGFHFRLCGLVTCANMHVTKHSILERTIAFELNIPHLHGNTQCVLLPLTNGTYRLVRVDRLMLPRGVMKVLDATQRAHFERLAADFLRALREVVERGKKAP